jgi:hypothetical protein
MLIDGLREIRIDLLDSTDKPVVDSPISFAFHLAKLKFREQMGKVGLTLARVREANLEMTKLPDSQNRWLNDRQCIGHKIRFVARVVIDTGKTYERELSEIVACHDPRSESRSNRYSDEKANISN